MKNTFNSINFRSVQPLGLTASTAYTYPAEISTPLCEALFSASQAGVAAKLWILPILPSKKFLLGSAQQMFLFLCFYGWSASADSINSVEN